MGFHLKRAFSELNRSARLLPSHALSPRRTIILQRRRKEHMEMNSDRAETAGSTCFPGAGFDGAPRQRVTGVSRGLPSRFTPRVQSTQWRGDGPGAFWSPLNRVARGTISTAVISTESCTDHPHRWAGCVLLHLPPTPPKSEVPRPHREGRPSNPHLGFLAVTHSKPVWPQRGFADLRD